MNYDFMRRPGFIAFGFVLGLVMGYGVFASRASELPLIRHAEAQVSPLAQAMSDGGAAIWEYNSTSVDAMSLRSTLTVLGVDGWEVFSMTATESIMETGTDGWTTVKAQRFEVSAKRKKALSFRGR